MDRILNVNNHIVEGDYLNIIINLSGTQTLNRTISDFINEANKLHNALNIIIRHVYREGNSATHVLVNVGVHINNYSEWHNDKDLPCATHSNITNEVTIQPIITT